MVSSCLVIGLYFLYHIHGNMGSLSQLSTSPQIYQTPVVCQGLGKISLMVKKKIMLRFIFVARYFGFIGFENRPVDAVTPLTIGPCVQQIKAFR